MSPSPISTASLAGREIEQDKLIFKLDSQILNSMNLCPERYRLEHILNFRPIGKAQALEKGSVMHKMLDHYYRERMKGRAKKEEHAIIVEEAIRVGQFAMTKTSIDVIAFEDDVRVFKDYILKWQYDGWEILDVEQPFSKILYDDERLLSFNGDIYPGLTILYEGIVDLRIRDPKQGVAVVDHKTESRRSYPYILSNQFQGYEWAFDCPVIVNKIGYQTSLKDDAAEEKQRFRRLLHSSGQYAIDEWISDTVEQIGVAIGWYEQLLSGARSQLSKNRTSCDKYSGCIYQRVCQVPEESREFKLQAFFFKDKPWDPYNRDAEESKDEVA